MPGVAEAIRRLRAAGYRAIMVTNQPGIARGHFTEAELADFHECLQRDLARSGARLDGIYFCPYSNGDDAVVDKYRAASDLQKPRPGMLRRAAADMELDLSRSWMIGSSPEDIEAGKAAGCRTIFVGDLQQAPDAEPNHLAKDLSAAVDIIEQADNGMEPVARALVRSGQASEDLLTRILERLDRDQRDGMYQDFSLAKLGAGVAQVMALAAFIWGIFAALSPDSVDVAFVRLVAAVFLQLLTLTFLLAHQHS